jgi:hypothetical protein
VVLFIAAASIPIGAMAAYVPFSPNDASPIILKIIEKKTLPLTIWNKGIKITVKEVKQFNLNWGKSEFDFVCRFDISYSQFVHIEKTGEISIDGAALLAPTEGKIGIKLTGIRGLAVDGLPRPLEITALAILSSSFVGKEYWTAKPSSTSEILSQQNFSEMIRIMIAHKLPFTFRTGASHITFYEMIYLSSYRPGKVFASFYVRGLRSGLIDLEYAGVASVDLELYIDPETLDGYVKVERISKLKLENRSGFMQGIIMILTRSKMEEKTIRFSLAKDENTF